MNKMNLLVLGVTAIQLCLAEVGLGALPRYELIDLGSGAAQAINEHGQVVGHSAGHAFFWEDTNHNGRSDPGERVDLGTLGHAWSNAVAINNLGQVAGYSYDFSPSRSRAFFWEDINQNGLADPCEMQDLGTFGGIMTRAFGINDAGQVVGEAETDGSGHGNPRHAFLWDRANGMTDLYRLNPKFQVANDINNAGKVIIRSFVWDCNTGQVVTLELPQGSGAWHCSGKAICDSGMVAGSLKWMNGDYRPFLWQDGHMINLGTLGGRRSLALWLNDLGQVVGNSTLTYSNDVFNHAFIWDPDDGMVDLSLLPCVSAAGWDSLNFACEINNRGQIAGIGTRTGGSHAFLLNPVLDTAIDIRPGSCPNPLNLKSNGVLPVVILGTEDFDVNAIDVASIRLQGVAPIRSNFEDVSAPVAEGNDCECTAAGPDGITDLTLKLETRQIVEALLTSQGQLVSGETPVLTLTAVLSDGTQVQGTDCVIVVGKVPKSLAAKTADVNADGIVDMVDFNMIAQYWLESTLLD